VNAGEIGVFQHNRPKADINDNVREFAAFNKPAHDAGVAGGIPLPMVYFLP
jgi:hypothetical protein